MVRFLKIPQILQPKHAHQTFHVNSLCIWRSPFWTLNCVFVCYLLTSPFTCWHARVKTLRSQLSQIRADSRDSRKNKHVNVLGNTLHERELLLHIKTFRWPREIEKAPIYGSKILLATDYIDTGVSLLSARIAIVRVQNKTGRYIMQNDGIRGKGASAGLN